MKSLEARLADRARREREAEEQKKQDAEILATGTGAADTGEQGEGEGGDGEGEGYSTYTVEQLKAELDERGLEYKASAKKAELIEALEANDEE